jgi:hypothetical protein
MQTRVVAGFLRPGASCVSTMLPVSSEIIRAKVCRVQVARVSENPYDEVMF